MYTYTYIYVCIWLLTKDRHGSTFVSQVDLFLFFGILEPPAQQYDGMFGQEDYAHLLTVAEMLGPDVGWESP
jgi:hypothetical protein